MIRTKSASYGRMIHEATLNKYELVSNHHFKSELGGETALKILGTVVLLLFMIWAVNYFGDADVFSVTGRQPLQQNAELIKAGGECVAISEQATAHLVPKLEFQRLELAGRKANVVVRCMADRDFYQNPAWLKHAEPIAAKLAAEQHISVDEAIENLKRKDMLVFTAESDQPVYWQQVKKQVK